MAVTMKDIAELAGVSVGTVDRALNKRGRVQAEVAERICSIAEKLDYKTNSVAKSLAIRSKNTKIAVVLHIRSNYFFSEVLDGVQAASTEIADFGIQVQVYRCNDFDAAEQTALIDRAIEEGAGGLVLVPIDDARVTEKLLKLKDDRFPVMFLSAQLQELPCFPSVHCDYEQSGRLGGRMIDLISRGSGKFLAFMPSLTMFGHRQRVNGLRSYLDRCGSKLQLAQVLISPNDLISTYQIVIEALNRYPDVRHVLFCGNTEAYLRAVKDSKRDIKSVIYDGFPQMREAMYADAVSALILQDPFKQGYEAIMSLFRYFMNNRELHEILVDNRIILKENAN